jgi:hypothetical protein
MWNDPEEPGHVFGILEPYRDVAKTNVLSGFCYSWKANVPGMMSHGSQVVPSCGVAASHVRTELNSFLRQDRLTPLTRAFDVEHNRSQVHSPGGATWLLWCAKRIPQTERCPARQFARRQRRLLTFSMDRREGPWELSR